MYYTKHEIMDEVEKLTRDDLTRLLYTARKFLHHDKAPHGVEDVVQEAITRVLGGSWNKLLKNSPFIYELMSVVRSIASSFNKTSMLQAELINSIDANHTAIYGDDSQISQELLCQRIDALRPLIEGDDECEIILTLKLENLKKQKIIERMKISNTQYGSIYRRLIRKLRRIRPSGDKND